MRPLLLPLPLLVLTGCEAILPFIEEQRVTPTEIYWTGQVLDGPYAEDVGLFSGGAMTATDHAGEPLLSAAGEALEAPYETEDQPGTWVLTVPVYTDILLRLSGDGFVNTVWSTHTPGGRAYWFTGALFARTTDDVASTFAAYQEAGLLDAAPADLALGEVVHLWAEPLAPEAWAGAQISVTDGAGVEAPVVALTADEDGALSVAGPDDPVYQIFAFDLTPGEITLSASAADGSTVLETWPAQGGDLLNATFLGLSEAPDTAAGD